MNSSKTTYGRTSLLVLWLANRKFRNSHKKLNRFQNQVASAFSMAFKADLDHPPGKNNDPFCEGETLHRLFLEVADSRNNTFSSPFSGYMEAPKVICDLYRTHGKRIKDMAAELEKAHDDLLFDLMDKIWGITATTEVSHTTLNQYGYPVQEPYTVEDFKI